MAQISVNNLSFGYDGSYENVFENISFSVDSSWKLGLVGRNGRGKTTLLKILCNELEYKGKVSSSVEFSYFPFLPEDEWMLCTDIADEITGYAPQWKIEKELASIGLESDIQYRVFSTLSGGEKTKFLLAMLFLRDNNFLLIDEPTNHLDLEGREILEKYLSTKKGYIIVSHDRRFLDKTTDHTMSINKAGIDITSGSFSVWYENKQLRDAFEQKENDRLAADISRLESAAKRAEGWAEKAESAKRITDNVEVAMGHAPKMAAKSAKQQKRRKAIEKRTDRQIEEKKGLLKNIEKTEDLKITPLKYVKPTLLEISELSIGYDGEAVAENISFTLRSGDRVAVKGHNGCGKSTLLKLICGEKVEHSGRLIKGSGIVISYVPQSTDKMNGTVYSFAEERGCDLTRFLTILRKLDCSRELFERSISSFSMGQKKKVLIAASLAENAHLYIWDEPLNYIDLFSRLQIEQLLKETDATMLFVEHDEAFCEAIETRELKIGK